jgi:very-short-patch-repair endonuclease
VAAEGGRVGQVEVDGGQHADDENSARDRRRDAFLRSQGFEVLRFWNNEIDRNVEGVKEIIQAALAARPHPVGCADRPPHKGEG